MTHYDNRGIPFEEVDFDTKPDQSYQQLLQDVREIVKEELALMVMLLLGEDDGHSQDN